MTTRIAIRSVAFGALLAGCTAAPQPPVPMVGAPGDVQALAGVWEGSYSSAATGRSGSISFTLTPSGDSAFGDVIMIPRGWGRPLRAWDRTEQGGVAGARLAPYADPETGAKLFTRFEGKLDRESIEGTYTTTALGSATSQSGEWKVTRRKAS